MRRLKRMCPENKPLRRCQSLRSTLNIWAMTKSRKSTCKAWTRGCPLFLRKNLLRTNSKNPNRRKNTTMKTKQVESQEPMLYLWKLMWPRPSLKLEWHQKPPELTFHRARTLLIWVLRTSQKLTLVLRFFMRLICQTTPSSRSGRLSRSFDSAGWTLF
jgi:hypothetical protein